MGKAAPGSNKAIANAIKAKGLGRLRWYCQVCEKQCRDENGFQAHTRSEPHLRKIMLVGPKAGQAISDFSRQFQNEFVTLLRTRHQTNRVRANAVYNEYIQDKHHVHMNSTRWVTLNGFVMTLGKAGTVKVDQDEKGLWITWVDNRPETLAKQAALQKKDRADMDGEERERYVLEQQIARAKAKAAENEVGDVGLQKQEGEKVVLSFNLAGPSNITADPGANIESKPAGTATTSTSEDIKPVISFGTISTPLASSSSTTTPIATSSNPLKRPAPVNVFKQSKSAKTEMSDAASSVGGPRKGYMSESERLMKEDQARRMNGGPRGGGGNRGGYGGFGPQRQGDGGRRFVLQ